MSSAKSPLLAMPIDVRRYPGSQQNAPNSALDAHPNPHPSSREVHGPKPVHHPRRPTQPLTHDASLGCPPPREVPVT